MLKPIQLNAFGKDFLESLLWGLASMALFALFMGFAHELLEFGAVEPEYQHLLMNSSSVASCHFFMEGGARHQQEDDLPQTTEDKRQDNHGGFRCTNN